jgi:hypothetical protein
MEDAMRRAPQQGERRQASRRLARECPWLSDARLRHGLQLDVIDLAPGGALVEAPARLLPGSSVELRLAAPGWRWRAAARVLRCHVSALLPEQGARYRAALQFEAPLQPPAWWTEPSASVGCGALGGGSASGADRARVVTTQPTAGGVAHG